MRVLPDSVARKIAAGEVIERPASVLRELLDNAIDAESSRITVELSGGGSNRLLVSDNGRGMSPADLALCWLPHATSKISTEEDLSRICTLGFRGEALSAIAAVSRLGITSRQADAPHATRLLVDGGALASNEPAQGNQGTTVEVGELFYNLPARRQFLKQASTEAAMCRQVLLDKAAAFEHIAFRLIADGQNRLTLAPDGSIARLAALYPDDLDPRLLFEASTRADGFSIRAVVADPACSRKDRKLLQIFANKRRIQEFQFQQAVEYAFTGYLPGGAYPVAFVFIEVDPALADFNIHPAKREARFRQAGEIHHALVQAIQRQLRERLSRGGASIAAPTLPLDFGPSKGTDSFAASGRPSWSPRSGGLPGGTHHRTNTPNHAPAWEPPPRAAANKAADQPQRPLQHLHQLEPLIEAPASPAAPALPAAADNLRVLGQAFDLFVVAQAGDELYLIDQHAAHERILYDAYRSGGPVQNLLIAEPVFPPPDRYQLVRELLPELTAMGFVFEERDGGWLLTAAPAAFCRDIGGFSEQLCGLEARPDMIERDLYAMLACKAAIKDGQTLTPDDQLTLARDALALPEPRCPHGRPVWHRITRDQLLHAVRRIV